MKICEYEDVRCCYCGERERLKEMGKTTLNQHEIFCLSCSGTFFIPCED